MRATLVGAVLGAAWCTASGSLLQSAGAGLCGAVIVVVRARRARLRELRAWRQALAGQLPDVMSLLASSVDGGCAAEVALRRVAEFAPEPLRSVLLEAIAAGIDGGVGARLCAIDPVVRPLGALLRQSEELGVPIAAALRLGAADARARAQALARERAAVAAPKMLLVVGTLLAPAALLIVIGGQVLVLRDVAGAVSP